MQARQGTGAGSATWDRITDQQQQTAIILERLMARLDALETWRAERDRERERESERKDERIDKTPDSQRANLALVVSTGIAVFYLIAFIAQHWRP